MKEHLKSKFGIFKEQKDSMERFRVLLMSLGLYMYWRVMIKAQIFNL